MPKNKYQIYLDDETAAYMERLCIQYDWTMTTLVDRLAQFYYCMQYNFGGVVKQTGEPCEGEPRFKIELETKNLQRVFETCSSGIALRTLKIVQEGLTPADGFPELPEGDGKALTEGDTRHK